MTLLIKDAQLRQEFGTAGRKKVATEFNLNQEANWLAKIIRAYLDGPEQVANLPVRENLQISSL